MIHTKHQYIPWPFVQEIMTLTPMGVSVLGRLYIHKLEKWFPLHGERGHSLYFCIYIRRLEVSKNNRNVKEEETEQTY